MVSEEMYKELVAGTKRGKKALKKKGYNKKYNKTKMMSEIDIK